VSDRPRAIAEELTENVIDLEGHDLVAVSLGHTDTDNTTCLHVPSIGLVVAGDAAYNGVHLYLAESKPQTRREWIAALDTIEALNPSIFILSLSFIHATRIVARMKKATTLRGLHRTKNGTTTHGLIGSFCLCRRS